MARETAIERASETGSNILERVVLEGNLAELTPAERVTFYRDLCESLGLNPLSRPFGYITFQGQLRLYPLKDCTDQLRRLHQVSIVDVRSEQIGDLYVVTVKATTPNGRSDVDQGVVVTARLQGEALASQLMKAITKGKRRVTLSICGLAMPDESEIETMTGARVTRVDLGTGEILEPPAALPARTATAPVTASQPTPAAKLPPWPGSREQWQEWLELERRAKAVNVPIKPPAKAEDVEGMLLLARATVEAVEEQSAGEEKAA